MSTPTATAETQQEFLSSFAELEALLCATPSWPSVRAALGIQPPADEQVVLAGLASLIVRGLAKVSPDNVPEIKESVAVLVHRVGAATSLVNVTYAGAHGLIKPFLLCDAGGTGGRVMISAIGAGILRLQALVDDRGLPGQAGVLTASLLDAEDGTVHVSYPGRPSVAIRKAGGQWELAAPENAPFRPVSRQEALNAASLLSNEPAAQKED